MSLPETAHQFSDIIFCQGSVAALGFYAPARKARRSAARIRKQDALLRKEPGEHVMDRIARERAVLVIESRRTVLVSGFLPFVSFRISLLGERIDSPAIVQCVIAEPVQDVVDIPDKPRAVMPIAMRNAAAFKGRFSFERKFPALLNTHDWKFGEHHPYR